MGTFTKVPVKRTVEAAYPPSGTFTRLSTGEIIRPSSLGGAAGTASAGPVSAAERAARTLEANARKGASASNTISTAGLPASAMERAARTLEANARKGVSASNTIAAAPVSSVHRTGYSPGRERASRQYVSLPAEPQKTETAPVDYRLAAELNRLNHELNQLEEQRRQAAVDLDMDTLDRVNRAMKDIRAAQNPNGGFWTRLWNTVKGGGKGFLSSHMDTMGVLYQSGQGGRDSLYTELLEGELYELERSKRALRDELDMEHLTISVEDVMAGLPGPEAGEAARLDYLAGLGSKNPRYLMPTIYVLEASQRRVDAYGRSREAQLQTGEAARELAAAVQKSGAEDIARAKAGKSGLQNVLVDAVASTVQMAGDTAANFVLGTPGSMVPFAARAFGGGTMEARAEGADLEHQILYGGAAAWKEVLTEKMFNVALPFSKAYGGGALGDAVERGIRRAVDRFAGTEAGKKVLGGGLTLTASALSEGAEEFIGDWLGWQLPRIYGGDPASVEEMLEDSLYDTLVGIAAGSMGSLASPGTYRYEAKPLSLPATRAGQTAAQGGVTTEAARGAESAAAEPIRVGRVTTIKQPYQGQTPVQIPKNAAAVQVDSGSVRAAQNRIDGAKGLAETPFGGSGFKTILMKSLQEVFQPAKGVAVDGVTFDGKPYLVDINKTVPGKVVSDPNLTAEKLALLDVLPEVVKQGEYVGSGEYVQHGSKKKLTVRFDYFETSVTINGRPYVASFDIEVFPNTNNYRTHKLNKIELSPITNADPGPVPGASVTETALVEGTRPLNSDLTIAQGADSVKFQETDPFVQAILDSLKPAETTRPLDVLEQEVRRLYGKKESLPPEVNSDPLIQALLGSLKPAETTRPLDVLEQEVRRLYGPGGTASLEAGSDAPIQALLGDGKPEETGRSLNVLEREAADRKEFAEYQDVLGEDAPKSFAEFQDLKYNDQDGWEQLKTEKEHTVFVESAPCVTTPKKYTGYFLKPGAEHANEFFSVGYIQDKPLQLRYDMARQFSLENAVDFTTNTKGETKFSIFMKLGVTKARRFRTVWQMDTPDSMPRIITAHREDKGT